MPLNLNHFFCAQKSPFSRAKITEFDAHLLYDMAGPPARKRTRGGTTAGSNRGPASRTWGGYAQKGRGTGGSNRGPAATTRAPAAIAKKFPLAEIKFYLGERKFPLAEIKFPLGGKEVSLAEIKFPLGERKFPLAEIKFPSGERKFPLAKTHG